MRTSGTPRLKAVDWRTLPGDRMAAVYRTEAERWSSALEWDTAKDWVELERARLLGTATGVAVIDDADVVHGWSYYLVHHRTLQIGAFVSDSEPAAQLMLQRVLAPDVLQAVDAVTFFAFADAQGLAAALRSLGLSVDRYWYLGRDLQRAAPTPLAGMRLWREDDLLATAELFGRAYDRADEARPFAPHGTAAEWTEYAAQLTRGAGCGSLLSQACLCLPGGPNRLQGVALVTRIAQSTAHLAQLVVDPQMQGRRIGIQLLEFACAAATQAGCRRLTLLVGGRNSRARSLYEGSRFEVMGSFLAAGTFQPRRSTSVAPGGAAMTRR